MEICPTCSKKNSCKYKSSCWYACVHMKRIADSILSGNVGSSVNDFEMCFDNVIIHYHFER